jgi:hypothetical protein
VGSNHAQAEEARSLSETEETCLQLVLDGLDKEVEEHPEGKSIGKIFVVPTPVFSEENPPWISWLNHLRITTRESVVRQELLTKEGDFFDWGLVEENELHLIQSGFASIVVIVPLRSESNGASEVDLLVVTRDIWSLRLSSDFETAGPVINYAFLSLTETNLLGYNKRIQASFLLRQQDYDLGAQYVDPNVMGERYVLSLNQGFVLGRGESSELEGHYAGVGFGLPLYSRRATFGYQFNASYRSDVYRNLIGQEVMPFTVSWIDEDVEIPWEYPRTTVSSSAIFYRGFGYNYRQILRFGYGAHSFRPEVPDDLPEGSVTADVFRRSLESWEQFSSYFVLGYRFFKWQYRRMYNYNTYGLAEYVSMGPGFDLESNWANRAFLLSDRDYIYLKASAWWTWGIPRDGFVRLSGRTSTRLEETFRSKVLGGTLRLTLPSMGVGGRFVLSSSVDVIVDPISTGNPLFARGGEAGLRGLIYRSLQGDNFLQANSEYRTRGLRMWGLLVGLVAFHDMGGTFQVGGGVSPLHSVGAGIRILILSTNRDVLRVDYGIPVNGAQTGFEYGLITAGFGQAF